MRSQSLDSIWCQPRSVVLSSFAMVPHGTISKFMVLLLGSLKSYGHIPSPMTLCQRTKKPEAGSIGQCLPRFRQCKKCEIDPQKLQYAWYEMQKHHVSLFASVRGVSICLFGNMPVRRHRHTKDGQNCEACGNPAGILDDI